MELPDFSFNKSDESRDAFMLHGELAGEGYDWWWHSFTGYSESSGEEKAFFIEFFAINPAMGGDFPIFGQLPENKKNGIRPSYLMVKAGAWGEDASQINRFFGWNDVTIREQLPLHLSAGDCFLSETRTLGEVAVSPEEAEEHPEYLSDAGQMVWDLKIDKQIAFNVGYGASKALRETEAFEMFWHAEGMKTAYEGTVVYNGEKYNINRDTCYGYADKNWGKDFTSPWVWLSSNCLTSRITGEQLKNSVFDIGGGRPKVGPVALERKLLSAVWYEGEPFEFNFSKFWTLTRTKFSCKESKSRIVWRIVQETPMHKMMVRISCDKKDMLKIRYEAPDGSYRHRDLWNGGNGIGRMKLYRRSVSVKNHFKLELVDDIDITNVGCEYGEFSDSNKQD